MTEPAKELPETRYETTEDRRRIALIAVAICSVVILCLAEYFESPFVWWWIDGPHALGFVASDALGVLFLVIADVLVYLALYCGTSDYSDALTQGFFAAFATLGAYQLGALALLGPIVLVLLLPGALLGVFMHASDDEEDAIPKYEVIADIVMYALIGIEFFFLLFASWSPLPIAVAYPSTQSSDYGLEANLSGVRPAFEGEGIRGLSWQEQADWMMLVAQIEARQLDIGVDELPPVDIALTTGRVLGSFDGQRIRVSAQMLLQDDVTALELIEVVCHEEFHVLQELIEKNGIDAYDAHTHIQITDELVSSWIEDPYGQSSAAERSAYAFGDQARLGWARALERCGIVVDWTGTTIYSEEYDLHFEQYL